MAPSWQNPTPPETAGRADAALTGCSVDVRPLAMARLAPRAAPVGSVPRPAAAVLTIKRARRGSDNQQQTPAAVPGESRRGFAPRYSSSAPGAARVRQTLFRPTRRH